MKEPAEPRWLHFKLQAKQQLQNGKRMLKNAVGQDDIEKAIDLLTEAVSYSHGESSLIQTILKFLLLEGRLSLSWVTIEEPCLISHSLQNKSQAALNTMVRKW